MTELLRRFIEFLFVVDPNTGVDFFPPGWAVLTVVVICLFALWNGYHRPHEDIASILLLSIVEGVVFLLIAIAAAVLFIWQFPLSMIAISVGVAALILLAALAGRWLGGGPPEDGSKEDQ